MSRLPLLLGLCLFCSSAIAGTVVTGSMTIFNPTSLIDFGARPVGSPTPLTIGLGAPSSNTAPVQVTSVVLASPSFTQTNSCSGAVAPGGSCPLNATFTPIAPGSASATLAVTCITVLAPLVATFTFACDGLPHNLTLTGQGLLQAVVPTLDPTSVGILAMMLLVWGILFLRARQPQQRG